MIRAIRRAGMYNEEVFTLKEGDVVLQWPQRLSTESYGFLEAWTKLMLLKMKGAVSDNVVGTEDQK